MINPYEMIITDDGIELNNLETGLTELTVTGCTPEWERFFRILPALLKLLKGVSWEDVRPLPIKDRWHGSSKERTPTLYNFEKAAARMCEVLKM